MKAPVRTIRALVGFRGFGAFRVVQGRAWYSGSILCRPDCPCFYCALDRHDGGAP